MVWKGSINHMSRKFRLLLGSLAAGLLSGCVGIQTTDPLIYQQPKVAQVTKSQLRLRALPAPNRPVVVAVYSYLDQTGQLQPSQNFQSLSRAVTQGGTSVLVKALQDAGQGGWFTVVERERLDNLLKERQIIREMRQRYLQEQETPAEVLPSLLFAGVILEGGIIGYDSNTMTGGAGARFLAIGGSTEYRQDAVTVYLRAVSVRTGEVLSHVVAHKTIASFALSGGTFKFVKFDELLEVEAGYTTNEPTQIAVQEAIEKAVYQLVLRGVEQQLWDFADPAAGQQFLDYYARERQEAEEDITLPERDPAYPSTGTSIAPSANTSFAPFMGARADDASQGMEAFAAMRRPSQAAIRPHNR